MKSVRSIWKLAMVAVFGGAVLFGAPTSAHAGVNPSKLMPAMPQPKPAMPKAAPVDGTKATKKETKKCGNCCKAEPTSSTSAMAPKFVQVDLAIPGIQMMLPAEVLPEPNEPAIAEPEPPAEAAPKVLGIGGTPKTD